MARTSLVAKIMRPMTLHWKGRDWHPQAFAVCMAYDAFRLALGGKPSNFTPKEIVAWLNARATLPLAKQS